MTGLVRNAPAKPVPETAFERQARHRARREQRKSAKLGRIKTDDTAIDYSVLGLPKGPTSDERAAEDHAAEVKQIAATRRKVWKRTSHCEYCGDSERETAQKHPKAEHEMHEDPSRAKTRGLPPAERFNAAICGRICQPCHKLVTENVIRAHFHDEVRRHIGDFDIIDVASGHILRHMRRGVDARPLPATFEEA